MRRDRYRRAELQEAYQLGYAQMYDRDSFPFTDRMESVAEQVAPGSRAEAVAAAYEGGADALRTLAGLARESGKVQRWLGPVGR